MVDRIIRSRAIYLYYIQTLVHKINLINLTKRSFDDIFGFDGKNSWKFAWIRHCDLFYISTELPVNKVPGFA